MSESSSLKEYGFIGLYHENSTVGDKLKVNVV